MAERREIKATLGDASLGHLDDMADGDYSRGYFDAGPEGNYEGSLSADCYYEFPEDGPMVKHCAGTKHQGMIEPDGYRASHPGDLPGEYGFVRRPVRRSDVERN